MHKLELGRADLKIILNGSWEYAEPVDILGGISAEDACRRLEGCPHSIAELVRHMNYWQQEQLAIARGEDRPRGPDFKLGETDFGEVEPEEWETLRDVFLGSYADLLECADDPKLMLREPNEKCNVAFMLANHALHNAYHLGQIAQLRRMMGNWTSRVRQ